MTQTIKNFSTQITKLDAETPSAYVFVLQAKSGDSPLTGAQIDAARAAAISVLEVVGATATATTSVLAIDPIGENQTGRLLIDCTQEIASVEAE